MLIETNRKKLLLPVITGSVDTLHFRKNRQLKLVRIWKGLRRDNIEHIEKKSSQIFK